MERESLTHAEKARAFSKRQLQRTADKWLAKICGLITLLLQRMSRIVAPTQIWQSSTAAWPERPDQEDQG